MKTPAPDLQRWSEELARNPGSLSFLPLARAYRRQGRRDLALKVCTRGLEHHPNHVEAHALLALLHLEAGDRERAADEWSIVLRLKPGNFEALRGMGFRYLERNDLVRARQHLERALLIRPDDPAVQEALRPLDQRQESTGLATAPPPPPSEPAAAAEPETAPPARQESGIEQDAGSRARAQPDWLTPQPPGEDFPFEVVARPSTEPVPSAAEAEPEDAPLLELDMVVEEPPSPVESEQDALPHAGVADADPWAANADPWAAPVTEPSAAIEPDEPYATQTGPADAPPTDERPVHAEPAGADGEPAIGAPAGRPDAGGPADPNRLFDDLLESAALLGALLLDDRGLVLAGALGRDIAGRADDLGAIIGGAIDDAARTVAHLDLGEWRVMLLESEVAVIHVSPIEGRGILVLAARRDAPTGWVMRTAAHAVETAKRFLEAVE